MAFFNIYHTASDQWPAPFRHPRQGGRAALCHFSPIFSIHLRSLSLRTDAKKAQTSSHDHTQNRHLGKGGIRYPSVYSQNQTGLPPQDVFPDGVRNQGDPIEPT